MSLLYDIAKSLFEKHTENENQDIAKNLTKMQGKMNAITKMAKDAIFSYPVLFSEGIVANDEDLMYAICGYLETQYAAFTMIAMGLNPVFAGNDPKSHIATFYSEENLADFERFELKPNATISVGGGKFKNKVTEEHLKEYQSFEGVDSGSKEIIKEETGDFKRDKRGNPLIGTDGKKIRETREIELGISARLAKLETKVRSSDPTIVNVKLKMAENQHEVEFPIAVKAMPRFVTTGESTRIFSYLRDDKPLVRIVKLLSGEIGLFKDIILQMERAKKDKELYAKLGRHPWFREMMERRTGRKWNGLAQLIPGISDFVKGRPDVLPICSLCVTKDEIEKGFSNLWANIKKSDENIMDKLMLLCLCIVDTTTRTVEFDFYGLKNNTVIRADSLIKDYAGGNKDGKDMEKLIQSLIYKV